VDQITIVEMSPRDGLQNEKNFVPTALKIELIDRLSAIGFTRIEVASFVSARWVPQLADASEVMAGINRAPGVRYAALTPNLKGFQAAALAQVNEVAVFASASEGFSQKNINCSIDESFARFQPIFEGARALNLPVRGYVSCITDCPYDGRTKPDAVAQVAHRLIDMGCTEVSLGDTIGKATPETLGPMLDAVTDRVKVERLAGHFHNTGGRALDNIRLCLSRGLRVFDACVGGLGGCPFAPGAQGNVATEAVARMVEAEGFTTGLDLDLLDAAGHFALSLREARP